MRQELPKSTKNFLIFLIFLEFLEIPPKIFGLYEEFLEAPRITEMLQDFL